MKVKLWMLAFASVVLLPFVAMAEAALPKAAVTRCAPVTLTRADHNYMVWPSGDATVDRPLQIVMNFKAQESLEEAKAGAYGKYKCDFYLSIEGLAETSIVEGYSRKAITANDCYLAGNYGSFGWIVIPTDGLVLEEGISYPVVSAYDANLTYEDICGSVKDFTAAIYVAPAILAANPDFKVSLALKMTDPNDASKVLTIGEPATYTVKDLLMPTATVSTLANEELTFALNFKADKVSPEALEYFGSWYADFELSVNKETVFNANGGANGYLSGQYDEWSENWVNVPFEDVTLAANEPLKIMAYAAKMLGQSGLKLTYRDVYEGVKDFDCGVFFEPDFLTANPDLEVTLELRMYNPENESESYVIGKTYVFTLGEKPTVVIPENVTAPEGVQNNAAVEETPVVLPAEVKTFEISLASVTTEATETAKVTFNVEPKNAEGVKVAAPSKAITFRLPLPSAWSGFAKVTHEDELLGIYDIQEANGNKFVEITSQAFSEYAVEQSDIVLPSGVTSASFGTDTVTDGTTYYATLQAAVEAVCGTAGATLYCKPGADVGALQHAPVTATLTVYGNGASVSGGAERDFDIGNTDPSGGKDITADMTLTVKDLDGCGAWGAKATTHTVNLVFDGCRNMGKVFITGTTGTLNITIKDASFEGVIKEAVYSNADGAITLSKVDFSNLNKAVNLNHKAAGTQTVAIENCSFTNCGADVAADQIPVRLLSSVEGGKSVLTVSGTTFTGTPEGGADILLDYGVGETTATISTAATAAHVVVEKTNNVGTTTTVPANTQNQSFATVEPVAKIGEKTYSSLQAAFDAVQDGDTITLLVSCAETITFTQTKDVSFVIDGNQQTMTGSINITARAGKDAPSTLTIKNFKFTTDKIAHDFIKSVETNYYPNNITIENCSFTGTADITSEGYAVVAVRLKSANKILVKDCTGSGLHSFLQNTAGWNVNLENVDVTDSLGGFAMGTVQGTTIKDCDLDVETMGIRLDAQYNNDAEITDCNVTAFIPVVVRKASVDSSLTFSGTNTMTAENTDGLWCAIGTSEYKENGTLPTAPTSKVVVTLKDTGLPAAGLYGNYYVASVNGVTYLTLAEAVAAAQSGDTILLKNGEYELPLFSDKELTFKGESKEDVIINDAPDARAQGWNGSTFHFETLTAKGATANYHGLANGVVAVTYKDCIIKGLRFLYARDVSFEGCAFTAEGVEHSFWTYGASNVTVSNCSFTYTDRAVNCYSENGADHEVDIAFSECTFTYAGTSDAPAGAVEINSSSVKSIDLSMDACTAPVKGAMWYNSQWDSTQGEKTTVVVDEQPVWPLVAEVNGVKYATFEAALAAAQAGNTIKLLRQVTCSGTTRPQFSGEGVVYVDLNGYIFVSNNRDRVRLSDKILFTGGFGWEMYQHDSLPTTNVEFRVFPTLEAAVTYNPSTNNPARIYPYQNVTQAADVTLKAYPAGTSSTICVDSGYEIVWDLNGYAVTQESPTGNPLEASIRGKLTLVDSSDTQTGKWIAGACGVKDPSNLFYGGGGPAFYVLGEGELILKGGTVSIARNATPDAEGNEIINTGGLIRLDDGKLTVDGATLQVDDAYGIMIWGGEAVIQSGTFDLNPSESWALFARSYYAPAQATINSPVTGGILVVSGADVTVNVPGVQYYEGPGYVAPSVGEGLMAFDGIVLEAGEAVVTTETTITPYATLAAAFTAAQPGDTVTIMSGTYNQGLTVDKAITVVGATDAEGNNLVTFNGTLNVTAEGATVKNINVNNPSGNGGRITTKNVLIEGCSVVGANGFRYCYTTGTVTFKDSVITGQTYGIHFDGSDGGNIVIDNCVITGWTSFAGAITNVAIEDTTFANGNYNQLRFYQNAQMTNVKFNEEMTIDFGKEDVDAAFTGCTVVDSEGNPSTKPLTDVIYKGDIADMGVDVTIDTKPMTVEAKIGEVYYLTLQEALNAAAKGTGEVAVDVLTDIDMTGKTWTPVRVSDPGYPFVTVNGNDKTITGLTDMLFSGTWAGKSGLVINDLTIADSTIVNDENDAIGTVGVGAFIGYPSASETITLKNCHLKNSTVKGGHWTGGLVGIAGGYSGNDGPVFMTLTFEGCSVTGSTITGKGSAGGIIGHAANDAWTNVIIKEATVSDNTITSTGTSANKAGSVMGTIGAAGQSATAGGETKQGGVAVAATTSGNAVTSAATTITTIYGRQGSPTGMLEVTGGTYEANPIEDNVAYAAPAEGYIIKQNDDGTYGLVELPAVSMTVTMNGTGMTIQPSSHTTLSEALKRLDVLGSLITLGGGISLVEITINKDIEDAEIATIKYNTTINGNGKTLTYTGTDRAIDVPNTANGANVTIKDLTVVATSAERGINYNTNGTLTVENVTVTSKMYAINFPTSADNATVSIKDSELTSAIALNIWGSDMEITVTDSELYSVENDPKFSYATIQLNRDGFGNIAEGTTIVVNGGKLSAIDENGNPSIVVSNWTATGEATVSPTTEVIGSVKNAVAMVGGACFYTLQDAIDDVVNEGYTAPIVVIRDIALTETVTVPANATVTLDLNGQTVSMTKAETVTANHEMILNKGDLTIQDTLGGGKLSYQYTGASLGTSYAANTITTEPGSALTVKSGTIENLTYEGGIIAYAVDGRTNGGLGDVTVNIEGGTITSKRQSIRIFANSTTKTGALNISGGEVIGRVIVQNASANANKAALSITGGTFNANAYKTEVLYVGGSNGATIDMTPVVSGGTFNGAIASTMTEGFISGGVFVTDVSDYCVAGYKAEQNAEGTYGIVVDPAYGKVAKVGEGYYDTLVAAVAAAASDQTVTLLTDASGDGIIINKSITIDLNGKTYTIDGTLVGSAGTKSCGFQILSGNTVTIQNGAIVMDEDAVRGHDGLPGNNFVIQNYADLTLKDLAITGNSKTSYVVSINSGTVALTGNTSITAAGDNVAFDVYDYSSAGYAVPAVTVDTIGTIIGRIEVSEAASLAISNGTYTVAIAPEWCAEGFIPLVNGDGTYGVKQGQYLAQIGDKQYESVAAALAAARAEGVTELTITLIGTNTSATEDTFDLAYGTAFDNVTIQQNNGGQPYYIAGIYTGDRTATEGKFILDGVNITSVSNIWFECDVVLKNNAVLTRSDDSKNFVYYGTVTIEPGSKFVSQIDDVMAGEFIVDGGKTDGSYCAEPAYKSIYVDVRSGQTLTLKNGAYALFNAANEIGRLTLNGNAEIADSKLEVFENIVMGENAKLTLGSESFVSTKIVTGSGVIEVTVDDVFEGVTKQIIAADMTGFIGTIDMVNNTECEMVYIADATGLTIMKVVAYVGNVPYATLEEIPENATGIKLLDRTAAVAAAQKVVAQSGDKVVSGGDAYDVASLLGGTFSKVVDATSQTSVLCYNYDFGVSHVQYTWADDVTLGTKVPLVNVTAAIKDADATTARTLDARALVIEVRNDAETVLRTIYVEAPAFTVQGGQVIYIHPVDVSDILTLDAALYFTVRVTDTWSNNVEEEEDVEE